MENVPTARNRICEGHQQPSSYANRGSEVGHRECSMCGDVGLKEELFRCRKCWRRYQHTYCSNWYPKKRSYASVCNWCAETPSTVLASTAAIGEEDAQNADHQFCGFSSTPGAAAATVGDHTQPFGREGSRSHAKNEPLRLGRVSGHVKVVGSNSSSSPATSATAVAAAAACPQLAACSTTTSPTSTAAAAHTKKGVRRYKLVSDVY